MPPIDWVVGRGLLGNAVARTLDREPMSWAVDWSQGAASRHDLHTGLSRLYATQADSYRIFWCAGSGVTSTGADVLQREAAVFAGFLEDFAGIPADLRARTTLFLASSVGGAYAGNPDPPFTETSPAVAASAYGETKLAMESALREAVATYGMRGFIGRITNLYGPGQRMGKRQGLISVVCETYLTRQPATVYVSLDTLRDYIYEDDCAAIVVAGTARAESLALGDCALKIIGAGTAVSIGELLGTISRVRRRRPLVAFGGGNALGQAPDLRVRSEIWPDLQQYVSTSLPAGIDAVFRAMTTSVAHPSM
ncbi:NAD-dependent epimerase/dehydratase family protein [Microbacterium sp. CFH 90308]|uniref:NAD-dependent epimerase/dehydratase family protein n=1 Tax=Microbacterium salsuginis TaxID=2722803 RepID=A0ABX1KCY7_9MICO|nr:NAD-dependent epimerase/dehydratase family protein [Microbacterium sp. CFH 90308]NLP83919.1 NAD-dependent epimerase/dehydratase family protein [Microbacterium sp. CFH 90308]